MADKIIVGSLTDPLYEFEASFIDHEKKPLQLVLSNALSGDELAIDQMLPRVYSDAYIRVRFVPSGSTGLVTSDGKQFVVLTGPDFFDKLPYATPIWYYSNGVLMGKFYSKHVVRTGTTAFDLYAMSPIGVLEGQTHTGGVYQAKNWASVANEIIGGAVPFTVDDAVASIPVFGWLPKASRRDNLHELLFSYGVMAAKDENGDLLFRFPDTETVKEVPDSRIFFGGNLDYQTPATRVDVTEHAFLQLPTDAPVTLFDNTDGSGVTDHTTIDFREAPIYGLEVSGSLVIHESSVNHAVLSGTGVLTGRKYTHTTKVISLDSGSTGENRTVSISGRTLISVANSQNVARRLLSFYGSSRTISADLLVSDEKPGDLLAFNDPFGDRSTAFLSSMDASSTSFLRAACQLITNYTPAWGGNNYSRVIVLTGTGTWTYTGRVRAVLISGGEGGWSGGDGATPETAGDGIGLASEGGKAGNPGRGGRILSISIDVDGVISYSCGVGGLGGINSGTDPVAGSDGTDTIFGAYTTRNGERSQTGAVNLFNGSVYAIPGESGVDGTRGASADDPSDAIEYNGATYVPGLEGADNEGAQGGYGGGPAAGSNGGDGRRAIEEFVNGSSQGYTGGRGGDGGNAVSPPDAIGFGFGGNAGHGGGGAGSGGYSESGRGWHGRAGNPGNGSNGSRGGDGCIIIYY